MGGSVPWGWDQQGWTEQGGVLQEQSRFGMSSHGRCDTQSCFSLFLSPPCQCLSQGSTNEVSLPLVLCMLARPSSALGSQEKLLGPKISSGLGEDGRHEGSGQQLLAWLALAVPGVQMPGEGCGCGH